MRPYLICRARRAASSTGLAAPARKCRRRAPPSSHYVPDQHNSRAAPAGPVVVETSRVPTSPAVDAVLATPSGPASPRQNYNAATAPRPTRAVPRNSTASTAWRRIRSSSSAGVGARLRCCEAGGLPIAKAMVGCSSAASGGGWRASRAGVQLPLQRVELRAQSRRRGAGAAPESNGA